LVDIVLVQLLDGGDSFDPYRWGGRGAGGERSMPMRIWSKEEEEEEEQEGLPLPMMAYSSREMRAESSVISTSMTFS
jgi:hypothetical protein